MEVFKKASEKHAIWKRSVALRVMDVYVMDYDVR